eukprot:6205934-Pleurochrysis_carterae.AAC.1
MPPVARDSEDEALDSLASSGVKGRAKPCRVAGKDDAGGESRCGCATQQCCVYARACRPCPARLSRRPARASKAS